MLLLKEASMDWDITQWFNHSPTSEANRQEALTYFSLILKCYQETTMQNLKFDIIFNSLLLKLKTQNVFYTHVSGIVLCCRISHSDEMVHCLDFLTEMSLEFYI